MKSNKNVPGKTNPVLKSPTKRLRFAVIGVGNIAQVAVIPAFRNAQGNCELVAFVTGSVNKAKKVATHQQGKGKIQNLNLHL